MTTIIPMPTTSDGPRRVLAELERKFVAEV